MLRFQPDSWVEGLLRPVLLADPSAGLYYEDSAPDWRFLALVAVLVVAFTVGRGRSMASHRQRQALLMLGTLFYVWTLTIGNGRYFIAGLLMAGPLLVMAWQWLPGSRALRGLLLLGFIGFQALTVQVMYRPGSWFLAGWRSGPAVALEESPLRNAPAVFVTLTMNSYSALVPYFHPQSRWANLGPHMDISPGQPEYPSMRALLSSSLPRYLVVPASRFEKKLVEQPDEKMQRMMNLALGPHQIEVASPPCTTLRTNLLSHNIQDDEHPAPVRAFWICPLRTATARTPLEVETIQTANGVFSRIEAYCPRFFPTGQGITRRNEDHWVRYYPVSDTHAYIEDAGFVTYKYFRHHSPVLIGTVEEVRAGSMKFDCTRLRGRYLPPWVQD